MASFVLRKIDVELWRTMRKRCRRQDVKPTAIIESLLRSWLHAHSATENAHSESRTFADETAVR